MKVILFGATGMVGQGVLRECLLDDDVSEVLSVGRSSSGQTHAKLKELVRKDLFDLKADELAGYDACFFCLGVSAAGMSEADYTKLTHDLTLSVAKILDPKIVFTYVSGAGTDEKSRAMWARVKGRTERELLERFPNGYMFRPGLIQPKHGAKSRTRAYRITYAVLWPFMPLIRLIPGTTSTEIVGKAMLAVARKGADKKILDGRDIARTAA